ncbi:MAG: thioredoxin domain-containing protein [Lysobacterales bacterium]
MNRLGDAPSPYLQQHASQPVHWWPWCDEAMAAAREKDLPVLLSIGYSACHWCHVMAEESFDDPETAEVINEHFVSIKVDREERPDLDRIYQLSHQVITEQPGGWPLTLVLDPYTQTPFFAGTYFPAEGRHGVPGFSDVLVNISKAWNEKRDALNQQTEKLRDFLSRSTQTTPTDRPLTLEPGGAALSNLKRQYDPIHGGFGSAPKFPNVPLLRFLLDWSGFDRAQRDDADAMVTNTLQKMAAGGLFDQLGGGFFRYSVDGAWSVPHFEKMVSDNAQLLGLYASAGQRFGRRDFLQVARQIAAFMERELKAGSGGFITALDADSDGGEGRYYLWEREEILANLSSVEAQIAGAFWGLNQPPNVGEKHWHLGCGLSLEKLAKKMGIGRSLAEECLVNARRKLLGHRRLRSSPNRDDKVLSANNGLAIGALASAARISGSEAMVGAAQKALDFVRSRLWKDGRLQAVSRGSRSYQMGFLDDYAFLLDGVLELLATSFRPADLEFAQLLARALLTHFEDPYQGGFFFTASDHETLIQRPRPLQDDATPAGNAVAARGLLRLGRLLDNLVYVNAAERTLKSAWDELQRSPQTCGALLGVLDEWLNPPTVLVLRGETEQVQKAQSDLAKEAIFRAQVYALDSASLTQRYPAQGSFTAYRCDGTRCSAPILDPGKLAAA